jgi:hypothetical protein
MKNISLNFGSIKDTIFRYSSKTIINEGKTSSFVDLFVEELKKKPILKLQYLIYKNIENANFKKEYLAERYLNQNINLIKDYNWNDILKENKDFRVDILKNFHVESSPEKAGLFESIHILIKSKTMKNFNDLDDENRSYETVINYLTRDIEVEKSSLQENKTNEEIEFPKLLSWKYVTELAVNNFNERYSHLNESEQNLVKILMSEENYKVNYLEDLKQENLTLINTFLTNAVDSETANNLNKFKNKIENLTNSNLDESIINLYELNLNLKD